MQLQHGASRWLASAQASPAKRKTASQTISSGRVTERLPISQTKMRLVSIRPASEAMKIFQSLGTAEEVTVTLQRDGQAEESFLLPLLWRTHSSWHASLPKLWNDVHRFSLHNNG